MSKEIVYKSIFAELIAGYIEENRAVGYKFLKASSLLKQFDTLVYREQWTEMKLSKQLVLLWTKKRPNETVK